MRPCLYHGKICLSVRNVYDSFYFLAGSSLKFVDTIISGNTQRNTPRAVGRHDANLSTTRKELKYDVCSENCRKLQIYYADARDWRSPMPSPGTGVCRLSATARRGHGRDIVLLVPKSRQQRKARRPASGRRAVVCLILGHNTMFRRQMHRRARSAMPLCRVVVLLPHIRCGLSGQLYGRCATPRGRHSQQRVGSTR